MAPKAYSSFFFQIPQLPETAPPLPSSQFRSFLSLDIADSVLSRAGSVRSNADAHSIYSQSTASSFFPSSLPLADSHRKSRPTLVTPTRAHPSRSSSKSSKSSQSSSHRALPLPKPAPQATLPAVPTRPTYNRAQTVPSRPRAPKVTIKPAAIPLPPSPSHPYSPVTAKPRPASAMTGTSSAASTNYRRTKRTDALAVLEGRARPRPASPPPYSPIVQRTKSAAPILATKSFMPFSEEDSDSDDDDDEYDFADDVAVAVELVPMPSSPDLEPEPQPRAKKGRARAGTIESWFVGPPPPDEPKNFMDFEDADAGMRAWAKRTYGII